MVRDPETLAGEVAVVITLALNEIKDAVRELRSTTPDSVLVHLAERKIEMIEGSSRGGQDLWEDA